MSNTTYFIFHHPSNPQAVLWSKKISAFLRKKFPRLQVDTHQPQTVVVLGGDGTMLEAARKYQKIGAVILGLNLGHVGFLASVRKPRDFLPALAKFFQGRYNLTERMMIAAEVKRKGRLVFATEALNEIVIKNPLGMVELQTKVAGHPVQEVRGTGVLIATATGSTAYNLSAHGPIIMPDIKCLIITELLDHSIPTPSVVVKYHHPIKVKIRHFRKNGQISLSKTKQKIDVLLIGDGESIFPLEKGDEVTMQSSPHLIKFAELEKHYFFKSLQEKFGFK